uniref:Uncharacterized protein n=1 Tax=Thermofilum pendens TaxID=2269 RepID=A0A7C3WSU9_THEPE
MISAKATLAALVYLLSVGAAAATTAVSGRNAVSLATLALAHAPVVVASVMIFSLLAYVVEEGLPPGDLYSRMLYLLLPFSLGFLTLATPAVAYALALWLLKHPAPLTLLALVALAELAAAALVLAASR